MENKKKVVVSSLKKTLKSSAKPKNIKKPVAMDKKTKKEIEEMFSASFGCDCSCCAHKCGDAK